MEINSNNVSFLNTPNVSTSHYKLKLHSCNASPPSEFEISPVKPIIASHWKVSRQLNFLIDHKISSSVSILSYFIHNILQKLILKNQINVLEIQI